MYNYLLFIIYYLLFNINIISILSILYFAITLGFVIFAIISSFYKYCYYYLHNKLFHLYLESKPLPFISLHSTTSLVTTPWGLFLSCVPQKSLSVFFCNIVLHLHVLPYNVNTEVHLTLNVFF